MLGHRVNSEGLRGRANAPRRRRTQENLYRVSPRLLSTFPSVMKRKKAATFACFHHLSVGSAGALPFARNTIAFANSPFIPYRRRTAATFLRRSLGNPSRVANGGKRQHHLSFSHLAVRAPGQYVSRNSECVEGRGV